MQAGVDKMSGGGRVLSGWTASWLQAGWSARRLWRGRMLWVAVFFALAPVLLTIVMSESQQGVRWSVLFGTIIVLTGIVPPLFAASTTADELEDHTYTYLWSRPLPRWSVLAGKLMATAPFAAVLLCLTLLLCYELGRRSASPVDPWPASALPRALGALALAAVGISMVSGSIAVLMPRHGLGVTYAYLLALDAPLAVMPFSIANLSITHHIVIIAGAAEDLPAGSPGASILWLLGIGGVWLAVALVRLARSEFSTGEG